jgi:hypothetical protein
MTPSAQLKKSVLMRDGRLCGDPSGGERKGGKRRGASSRQPPYSSVKNSLPDSKDVVSTVSPLTTFACNAETLPSAGNVGGRVTSCLGALGRHTQASPSISLPRVYLSLALSHCYSPPPGNQTSSCLPWSARDPLELLRQDHQLQIRECGEGRSWSYEAVPSTILGTLSSGHVVPSRWQTQLMRWSNGVVFSPAELWSSLRKGL